MIRVMSRGESGIGSDPENFMTAAQKNERFARAQFEDWAKQGTRPEMYPLKQCANDDYVSVYTENAWKAFFAGWNARA